MKSCCFIGHRNCPTEIRASLLAVMEQLIIAQNVDCFYVGTQGRFDRMAYDALCQLEKEHRIQWYVVLAYLNRTADDVYYDSNKTIYPDELTKTPLRFAIRRRNSFMIERSDFMITYLDTPYTNTYRNVEEAIRKKKKVINLGTYELFKK